jgi:hypothetical protein
MVAQGPQGIPPRPRRYNEEGKSNNTDQASQMTTLSRDQIGNRKRQVSTVYGGHVRDVSRNSNAPRSTSVKRHAEQK